MHRVFATFLLICLAGSSAAEAKDAASKKEAKRLERAAEVFREILTAPDQGLPQDLLDRAHCVVVLPSMLKAGFVFGGRYGKGVLSCRKSSGPEPWGPPSMVMLGGASFGAQVGGAAIHQPTGETLARAQQATSLAGGPQTFCAPSASCSCTAKIRRKRGRAELTISQPQPNLG